MTANQSDNQSELGPGPEPTELLRVTGVHKHFGGVKALNGVSLTVKVGEILGLAGENGAGKSTLFNIITGMHRPDAGELHFRGERVEFRGLQQANDAGIFRVYQDQGFIPAMRVYENLLLGEETLFSRAGVINREQMIDAARHYLDLVGASFIDPLGQAARLSFSDRHFLGIARAVGSAERRGVKNPVLLFDEPTAAMAHNELDTFMELMSTLRSRGAGIVFVSHRLREILAASDRIYILKDGAIVAETDPRSVSEQEMHSLMVGRPRMDEYYHEGRQVSELGNVALELLDVSVGDAKSVSLSIRSGEIVGIGGVTGSGKETLGKAIAGAERLQSGQIRVGDRDVSELGVSGRIRSGIGYLPLDRHDDGVILGHSIRTNMTLTCIRRFASVVGSIRKRAEENAVKDVFGKLGIVAPHLEAMVSRLSGGNQQKVVFGRIILANASVMVLDNPTRGVDAGAKHEIYGVIRSLASLGAAILVITEDLPELIGLGDTIHTMRDGRISYTHASRNLGKPTENLLVEHMV